MIIREHQGWLYNNRFKVVIVIKEEEKDVKDLIKKVADEFKEKNPSTNDLFTDTLGCCYICDDPVNPTLTSYSITIYYKNGKTYTNKMCRDCLVLNYRRFSPHISIGQNLNIYGLRAMIFGLKNMLNCERQIAHDSFEKFKNGAEALRDTMNNVNNRYNNDVKPLIKPIISSNAS